MSVLGVLQPPKVPLSHPHDGFPGQLPSPLPTVKNTLGHCPSHPAAVHAPASACAPHRRQLPLQARGVSLEGPQTQPPGPACPPGGGQWPCHQLLRHGPSLLALPLDGTPGVPLHLVSPALTATPPLRPALLRQHTWPATELGPWTPRWTETITAPRAQDPQP